MEEEQLYLKGKGPLWVKTCSSQGGPFPTHLSAGSQTADPKMQHNLKQCPVTSKSNELALSLRVAKALCDLAAQLQASLQLKTTCRICLCQQLSLCVTQLD